MRAMPARCQRISGRRPRPTARGGWPWLRPYGAAFAGREAAAAVGAAGLSYCRGGQYDPGQVIAVSPIEPTQQATRNLR
jgi:hypothetical protein